MQDIYDKMYEELSKKLPHESDRKLLKELLEIQRRKGKYALEEEIKKRIEKIYG
jgi:hypothetical protein